MWRLHAIPPCRRPTYMSETCKPCISPWVKLSLMPPFMVAACHAVSVRWKQRGWKVSCISRMWTPTNSSPSVKLGSRHPWIRAVLWKRNVMQCILGHVECIRSGLLRSTIPGVSLFVWRFHGSTLCKHGWTNRRSPWDGKSWGPNEDCLRRESRFFARIRCGLR